MNPPRRVSSWLPDRGEVIWIDHNPRAGRERKDHHPFLVLSPAPFHGAVGLVVGCTMTSAASNRGSSATPSSSGCWKSWARVLVSWPEGPSGTWRNP
ncbi:MAG: type II toxin-antitoxin system PemK/MazF family toxin [Cyanobium sp.]